MAHALFCHIPQVARAAWGYAPGLLHNPNFRKGATTAFLAYLALVRVLRYKRYRAVHKKYQKKFEDSTLTPEDAQKIILVSSAYDMPMLLNYSLAFALFKTYAIPSIAQLLASTKELTSRESVSKRYTDTECLAATWLGCPISGFATEDRSGDPDPRAMIALARTNYLHSRYKISNGDFLYTLILFAVEPAEWAKRYGWRELTPLEEYAYCIFWVEIGKRMDIKDIPETPGEMRSWAKAYEQEHMSPNVKSKEVASFTTEELLYTVPRFLGLRKWVEGLTICMLDEPIRIAMMKPAQPLYKHLIVRSVLGVVAFVQKWLMLPRSDSNYRYPVKLELTRNKDGSINPRMHPKKFPVRPWYKPESKTMIGKVLDQLAVLVNWHSEIPSPSLRSDGYRLEEMGPIHMEKIGHGEILRAAAELQGCPITGAFAR